MTGYHGTNLNQELQQALNPGDVGLLRLNKCLHSVQAKGGSLDSAVFFFILSA